MKAGAVAAPAYTAGTHVVPAAHELEELHDELDLANAARAELDVVEDVESVDERVASIAPSNRVTDAAADAVDSSQYDAANGWDKVINATTEGNATYRINFIVKPEYDWLKIVATKSGTFNGTFGAWIEYMPSIQPVLAT